MSAVTGEVRTTQRVEGLVRTFETGANRDIDTDKFDYEGFLSPEVLSRYARYMHKNRHLRDGSLRDSDNWQKGIPFTVYMKSLWRHFMDLWVAHRAAVRRSEIIPNYDFIEEACCAIMFNVMGYLHEILKERTRYPVSNTIGGCIK